MERDGLAATDTRQTIMNAARAMVQYRGYNALSFREIAKEVGVKSASIHYHFPTKGNLATALARQYTDDQAAYLAGVRAASQDQRSRIKGFTDFFARRCCETTGCASAGFSPPSMSTCRPKSASNWKIYPGQCAMAG